MSEPAQPGATPGQGDQGSSNNDGGQQQGQQGQQSAQPTIDLKSLPADQLNQVLENPSLWSHPKIKELVEAKNELGRFKTEQDQQNEQSLEKQKKFEELANKRGTELEAARKENQELRVNQQLMNKLSPLGVVDMQGALVLIDRSKITVSDTGEVSGIDEAIEALKTDKAYLFSGGNNQPVVGNPSNGGTNDPAQGAVQRFKRSQLTQAFINANKEAVYKAVEQGMIEDDGPPPIG